MKTIFISFLSDSSINAKLFAAMSESDLTDVSKQCLVLQVRSSYSNSTHLEPVSCLDKQSHFVCEVRVQTVTYFAWFVANWFTFLLIFLLIVLVSMSLNLFFQHHCEAKKLLRSSVAILYNIEKAECLP